MSVRLETNGHATDVRALRFGSAGASPSHASPSHASPSHASPSPVTGRWVCGQDRPFAMVQAALQTLARAGEPWQVLSTEGSLLPWIRQAAGLVASGQCDGVVLFCADPALAACVANKMPGLRAAAVTTVPQAALATLTLAANLLAVEMPGRTFFEIRYILQTLRASRTVCPAEIAQTLTEMEGHAHR